MATLVVVRRDASKAFQHLEATLARELGGDLTLMWDRRTSDRRCHGPVIALERRIGERREVEAEWPDSLNEAHRAGRRQQSELRMPERRQSERRRNAPGTWGTLGFMVVRGEGGSP